MPSRRPRTKEAPPDNSRFFFCTIHGSLPDIGAAPCQRCKLFASRTFRRIRALLLFILKSCRGLVFAKFLRIPTMAKQNQSRTIKALPFQKERSCLLIKGKIPAICKNLLSLPGIPQALLQIHAAVFPKGNTLFLQPLPLYAIASKYIRRRQRPLGVDHPMARHLWKGQRRSAQPTARAPRGFPTRKAICP